MAGRRRVRDGLGDRAGVPGPWLRDGGDRPGPRSRRRGTDASFHARVPARGERPLQRRVPEGRVRAPRSARLRVPEGPLDAVQRLALRPVRRRGLREAQPPIIDMLRSGWTKSGWLMRWPDHLAQTPPRIS